MTEYRNEALVRQLQREIEENECGFADCCLCFFCGFFSLICIIPRYNARKLARDRLLIEMGKPTKPPPQQQTLPMSKITSIEGQRLEEEIQELRVFNEQQRLAELQQSHFPSSY
ncbi:hypothetical protein BD770DRAFT_444842 [Pilaira anomala]|nr:hypothetical protein BD770DRAFT_444842 [Pilaira anomala]